MWTLTGYVRYVARQRTCPKTWYVTPLFGCKTDRGVADQCEIERLRDIDRKLPVGAEYILQLYYDTSSTLYNGL